MNKIKSSKSYRKAKYIVYKQTLLQPKDHLWTFIGAFIGVGLIGYFQSNAFPSTDTFMLIGSFGATAVLVYGATNSPLAQPRNLVGGHLISAIIGVTVSLIIKSEDLTFLAAAFAVALSIVAMQITKTMHPPGGATALIATIGSEKIKSLEYYYVLSPVLSGVAILLIVALIFNNIPSGRRYPVKPLTIKKLLKKKNKG